MSFLFCNCSPCSCLAVGRYSPNIIFAERTAATSTGVPQLPPCDFKPQPYKGLPYDRVGQIRRENLSPGTLTFYKRPVLVHQGHMQWLFDHEGRRYLDMFAGIVTVSVGHSHPKVVQTLKEQADLLWHTTNIYWHPKIHEYAEKLASKMPGDLKVVYFVNSGSEANDLAMLMARMHTRRYDVISFRNAYHGTSPYMMGVTALGNWRFQVPAGFGVQQTINPDVYRGPWGGAHCRDSPVQTERTCACAAGECQACDGYVDQLQDVLRHSHPQTGIAGFFAESIQGVGGTVQYPKGYLKKAFELVREKGGVCISDEVQTGLGRTGDHYWGFEMHDVIPDIVTMAKGMGNGIPLAAVVTTPEIAACMSPSNAVHFNTFGGNPLSCAVGSTVLDVLEEDKCQERCRVVGTYLLEQLSTLRDEFDIVGDVRGKGLMVGLELVADKESKKPLPPSEMAAIFEATKDMGLLIGKSGLYGTCLRIKPPMCITQDDVDFTVAVLRKAFTDHVNSK
ncbi:hypothetical protein NP493_1149g00072 [Ridgeia piscesae]|uniref:Alanine--glyoxylate aminotransferase 2, mitochondrial n=1 Tax=Ridgeia piscesae TaxID=27915 RepID=A0AAD9KG61_RIDPI|nr:hypothetical protein NP493_1149g00072 [Ridgeia piscesae]